MKLTQKQIDQYWEDGYLFPIRVMSAEDAQTLRAELEQIEAEWLDNGLPLPLNTYKRVNSQVVLPSSYDIGVNERILDAVEGVLGPDILLYSVEFLTKEAHTKQVVTMHQDLTYWGMGEIDGLTTAWLALSPATPESGCMDFVQASHKNPILPHEDTFDKDNLLSRGQEIAVDIADEDKVAVVLQPGEISLHHGLTIHGSGPNTSDDRRIGCVIRYATPALKKTGGERDYGVLARGEDKFGYFNLYDRPSEPFSADSLALYETIRVMHTAVMMKGAKKDGAFYEKA
ncbi:phytanoyl-CoA dioxygenase family protein [Algirhabdus cladophorae]|uniref:phytanoyl-CoA dioxygenase family protein n=1 Tax=Algirhabdus cladophorae TaxID=3377108 RepID=UPI003B848933